MPIAARARDGYPLREHLFFQGRSFFEQTFAGVRRADLSAANGGHLHAVLSEAVQYGAALSRRARRLRWPKLRHIYGR